MSKTEADIRQKTSAVTELAVFAGKSSARHNHRSSFWQAYKSASETPLPRSAPPRVTDLLGKVLAISARTRRLVAPRTRVELDVFLPDGRRAVSIFLGTNR